MRRILCVLLALAMLAGLGGCARQPQRQSVTWFDLFDTVTILLGYTNTETEFSEQASEMYKDLEHYHRLFDIYNTYEGMNNLKTINDNAGKMPVKVERPVIDLILLAKRLHEQTNGKVNIAMDVCWNCGTMPVKQQKPTHRRRICQMSKRCARPLHTPTLHA